MKIIGAEKLQEHCMSVLDELDEEGLVITRNGKPVAKILQWKGEAAGSLIGSLKGKIRIKGDILETGEPWDAES